MSEKRKIAGLFLWASLAALFLWPSAPSRGVVRAEEPAASEREPGEIKHEAVSELPLPRDRTEFGIGERVFFWLERPGAKAPDPRASGRHEVAARKELADFVVWTVSNGSTLLPTVTRTGDRTMLTVELSDQAGQLSVGVECLDPTRAIDDRAQQWAPAAPAAGGAQIRRPDVEDKAAGAEQGEDAPWKKKLYRLSDLRKARETPFEEVERLAREIFSEPLADRDQALVYFHLAELYAQSGMIHPERVLEYSRRALALPLEPVQRTTLSIYRGDACLARRANEGFQERRLAAVIEYARGLAEIARHDLPAEPAQRKLMILYDTDGPDGQRAEEARQIKEALDFNARVDLQTTLLLHRNMIRQQLKALYFARR